MANQNIPAQNNQMENLKQMAKQISESSNPLGMMELMVSNNPNLKMAVDALKKCNGNPQLAFYELAKQKGADPSQILGFIK